MCDAGSTFSYYRESKILFIQKNEDSNSHNGCVMVELPQGYITAAFQREYYIYNIPYKILSDYPPLVIFVEEYYLQEKTYTKDDYKSQIPHDIGHLLHKTKKQIFKHLENVEPSSTKQKELLMRWDGMDED